MKSKYIYTDASVTLKSPPTDYETVKKYYGYLVISKTISLLHAFQMPIKLDPNRLDQRSDLEKKLKYHQSCKISLAIESLKGLKNDLLQIHLMMSIVHYKK